MKDNAEAYTHPYECIAVLGPTATGKSAVAQGLALHFDTEVISADSMQIYRGMDIGTAKLKPHERLVKHRGLDLVNPSEPYSVALFQSYARQYIQRNINLNRPSILCGGTGLYLRAVLEDFLFAPGDQGQTGKRQLYEQYQQEHGSDALYALLVARDPRAAELIHPHNTRRVVRALELVDQGESYADRSASFATPKLYYRQALIGLTMNRTLLYERINARVDRMFDEGLVDEVRALVEAGELHACTAAQAIGYKELISYIQGECTLLDARNHIKQASRRYAKRQLTWFRRYPQIVWFDVSHYADESSLLQAIIDVLADEQPLTNEML